MNTFKLAGSEQIIRDVKWFINISNIDIYNNTEVAFCIIKAFKHIQSSTWKKVNHLIVKEVIDHYASIYNFDLDIKSTLIYVLT